MSIQPDIFSLRAPKENTWKQISFLNPNIYQFFEANDSGFDLTGNIGFDQNIFVICIGQIVLNWYDVAHQSGIVILGIYFLLSNV